MLEYEQTHLGEAISSVVTGKLMHVSLVSLRGETLGIPGAMWGL